ncbi:hypothetical protein EYF80_001649 [Liparis tanakae]|uniref:Uncharacterized protein n=1 Tax=Liparis tanakae TaxID=230148 RepID=A0A4Z2JEJ5_9TELE|nr:hypothetical protein EYF80_001649 [Liparis tanakae]
MSSARLARETQSQSGRWIDTRVRERMLEARLHSRCRVLDAIPVQRHRSHLLAAASEETVFPLTR